MESPHAAMSYVGSLAEGPAGNKLTGKLGVGEIVLMVVATASPLAVMVANLPLIVLLGNGPAAPVDALIAMLIMLLFTVGFISMSRYIKNSGAFYAYIQKGLGRVAGLGSATLALCSYSLILIAIEGFFGYALADTLLTFLGIEIPWQVLSLAIVAVVGYFGYRHIELSAKVLGVALILEILIVIAVDFAVISQQGIAALDTRVFALETITSGSPGFGIMFAIFCFIGFEATVVFREEARDPERTIPIATYAAAIGVGIFYFVSMWCFVGGVGFDRVLPFAEEHPGDVYLLITEQFLGTAAKDAMQLLLITSLFAVVLSLHNVVVRYTYILGSYGAFPRFLSDIHPRNGSPHKASLVQTLCSFVVLAVVMAIGLDPVTQIYAWGATAGTIGYMVLLALTCVGVLVFFAATKDGTSRGASVVAPVGALAGILFCIWIAVDNLPTLVGGDNPYPVAFGIALTVAATFVVGVVMAIQIRARSPERYLKLDELT
jgi:amino acid transporter